MKFIRTYIKEGMFQKEIRWDKNVNLVFSERNTCGKTTLMRILLYSLGYPIPNTKKIHFEKCLIITELENDQGLIELRREGEYIEYILNSEKITYVLPEDEIEFHKKLWNCDNVDIINNLLGAIYIDQEKGWTLLNRGKVIGNIRFNIEELVRGLSNRDCINLINRKKRVEGELKRYRQVFNIAKYKDEVIELKEELVKDSYQDEIEKDLEILNFEYVNKKKELKRIEDVIKSNTNFKKYIESMKIYVMSSSGEEVPVNNSTIIGMQENTSLLLTKKKIILSDITNIQNKIEKLKLELPNYENQLSFDNSETLLKNFDKKIAKFNINSRTVKNIIDNLEKENKKLKDLIKEKTKFNNQIVNDLYSTIMKYAEELNLELTPHTDYLFTDNLKELSGAILHKSVFIFRMACIIEIQNKLNIKLPILIDSPTGKEVDKQNVESMMKILKRDFSDNQIILASIYKYNLDNVNIIEIKDRLITEIIEKYE